MTIRYIEIISPNRKDIGELNKHFIRIRTVGTVPRIYILYPFAGPYTIYELFTIENDTTPEGSRREKETLNQYFDVVFSCVLK